MNSQLKDSHTSPEVRRFALILYLSSFVGLVIPLGNIIAPAVIWLMKKDMHPFIDKQGKEVVNFNISVMLIIACMVIVNVMLTVTIVLLPLVFLLGLLMFAIGAYALVIVIVGAIKVNDGIDYQIPYLNFRFIK